MGAAGGNYIHKLLDTRFISDANLVSYWMLDGNANDSKGSNHGTATDVTYGEGLLLGRFVKGGYFNGSSSHIDFTGVPTNATDNWTISAWILLNSDPGSFVSIVSNGYDTGGGGANGYCMGLNGNTFSALYGGVSLIILNTSIVTKSWYHLAIVRSSGTLRGYVNGIQESTTSTAIPTTPTYFYIGSQTGIRFFPGYIDDVSIFNRALTADEVMELYCSCTNREFQSSSLRNDANLISYWRFEGNSNDSKDSNNGSDTSISYNSSYGRFGQGASFNGSSSAISFGNPSNLQLTSNLSVSCWLYFNTLSGTHMILAKWEDTDGTNSYNILQVGSTLYFRISGTGTDINNSYTTIPSTGVWYHVVGTYKPSDKVRVYLNTVEGTSVDAPASCYNSSSNVRLGRNLNGYYYNGYIDDLAIFSRTLTSTEVISIYRTSIYYQSS